MLLLLLPPDQLLTGNSPDWLGCVAEVLTSMPAKLPLLLVAAGSVDVLLLLLPLALLDAAEVRVFVVPVGAVCCACVSGTTRPASTSSWNTLGST